MRYVWLALSGVLLATCALQAQQASPAPAVTLDPARNPLDALLVQWEQKMTSITDLSAEIVRIKEDKVYGTREIFEGWAKFKKPGLALLDLHRRDSPAVIEKYICTGTFLYEFSQSNKQVRVHELPPPKPGQIADDNFLSFLFGMKAEEAKSRYDLKVVKDDNFYIYLEVLPRTPADKADFQKAQLAFTRSTMLPRLLIFMEPNGNRVNWDIPSIDINARLNRNEFTSPTLPPGWKYVRVPLNADGAANPGNGNVEPRLYRPKQP